MELQYRSTLDELKKGLLTDEGKAAIEKAAAEISGREL